VEKIILLQGMTGGDSNCCELVSVRISLISGNEQANLPHFFSNSWNAVKSNQAFPDDDAFFTTTSQEI
jgi:hypothetical protein